MKDDEGENEERLKFGFLDIVRIIGGLILMNAVLSYWFTSSTTWGYNPGKYTNPRFIYYKTLGTPLALTIEELSLYNGSDARLPIYVGINGLLFDVTSSREIYGLNGVYNVFAGCDCARVFHNGCLQDTRQLTYDLRNLPDLQMALTDIENWQLFFTRHKKYWQCGVVIHDDLSDKPPPPSRCKGLKYPG